MAVKLSEVRMDGTPIGCTSCQGTAQQIAYARAMTETRRAPMPGTSNNGIRVSTVRQNGLGDLVMVIEGT